MRFICFLKIEEPIISGHFKEVQIDEIWSFVKHRTLDKQWIWYAYDKESAEILAFYIGKRNDSACKKLIKKLNHLHIDTYCMDHWKSYKKYIPPKKHIISKSRTTHIERRNRDFRTHLKRLCPKIVCFYKAHDMQYGMIKAYIQYRNST